MSYWYSLNTCRHIVLSKQGYAKVDVHLPRRVVLVVDCIVQEGQKEIILYRDNRDLDVVVQDRSHCLCEWIKIKKRGSPNGNLHMVGVEVVQKCNKYIAISVIIAQYNLT